MQFLYQIILFFIFSFRYACYLVFLKKKVPDETKIDIPMFFGEYSTFVSCIRMSFGVYVYTLFNFFSRLTSNLSFFQFIHSEKNKSQKNN